MRARLVVLACAATIAGASGCTVLFDPSSSTDACELLARPSGIGAGSFRAFQGTTLSPIEASIETPSAACEDVLIVVSVAWRGAGNSVTDVRWNDNPMQFVPELGFGPARNQWFYLTDPAPATAGELMIAFNAAADSEVIIHGGVLTGVNPTATIAANVGDGATLAQGDDLEVSEGVSPDQLMLATVSSPGGNLSVAGAAELWERQRGATLSTIGAAADGPDPTVSFSTDSPVGQSVTYSAIVLNGAD